MPLSTAGRLVSVALVLMVAPVIAEPPNTVAAVPTLDHLNQIATCRAGLLDPQARPEERRRLAELLLSFNTPQSHDLMVELLGMSARVDVQRAVCGVLADRGRLTPKQLDTAMSEPLLKLLGANDEALRESSARALADFSGAEVVERLGDIAAKSNNPSIMRLAAIDALAPNTHRRDVVAQLIALLEVEDADIARRAVDVLEPLTDPSFGSDTDHWKSWWQEQMRLGDEAWLAQRLRISRDRFRKVSEDFDRFRDRSQNEYSAVATKSQGFQRELFRMLSAEQRDARLALWLNDPMAIVRRTALSIIKAEMADEGKRPEGAVLTALLNLIANDNAEITRAALEIVQNVRQPEVVAAVLLRLQQERDPATRHAVLKALGEFESAEAIPALIAEIASSSASPACVREAASALGRVASEVDSADHVDAAVEALRKSFGAAAPEDVELRAALLSAMAGVAPQSFSMELLSAVESENATIVRAAIRGLRASGEASKLPRLRTLTAHADPRVRLEAIEAVGAMGSEEADLERLLARLDPLVENTEFVRDAAWRGFRSHLSRRPLVDRIQAVDRLRDRPELEIRYLEELVDSLPASNGKTAEREGVLDRLGAVLAEQGRHAEAVVHLQALFAALSARSASSTISCGGRVLASMLRSGPHPQLAKFVVTLAAESPSDIAQATVVNTVRDYLDAIDAGAMDDRTESVLRALQAIPPATLGPAWIQLLERFAKSSTDVGASSNTPG